MPIKKIGKQKLVSHMSATVAFFKMNAEKYRPLEIKLPENKKEDEGEQDSIVNGILSKYIWCQDFAFLTGVNINGEKKSKSI